MCVDSVRVEGVGVWVGVCVCVWGGGVFITKLLYDKEVSSTQGNTHSCYNGGMRECVNRMIDVRFCDILTACLMAILQGCHCLLSV